MLSEGKTMRWTPNIGIFEIKNPIYEWLPFLYQIISKCKETSRQKNTTEKLKKLKIRFPLNGFNTLSQANRVSQLIILIGIRQLFLQFV